MLKFIRRNATATWVKLMFLAIVIVFVFWGIGGVVGGQKAQFVARVNGEAIDPVDFYRVYDNLVRVYREVYKDSFKPEMARLLDIKGRTVDQLISASLLRQEAESLGLRVTEDEVRDAIAATAAFQQDGRFNKDLYLRVLRYNGLTPAEFEEGQRQDLLARKLQDLITSGVHVSRAEAHDRYVFENEQVNLRFVKLAGDTFASEVELTGEEVQAYFDQHRDAFEEPERVRIEYVNYPPQRFADKAEVGEDALKEYYDERRDQFTVKGSEEGEERTQTFEEVRGQIETRLKMEAARTLARRQADADHARVAAGEAPAVVAEAAGLQAATSPLFARKEAIGDLGRDRVLADAAFAVEAGQTGPVVDTPTGFFVFRVTEKAAPRIPELHEVRERVEQAARAQRAAALAKSKAEALLAELQQGDLDSVAKAHRLEVAETGPFSRQGTYVPELGPAEELKKDAFRLTAEKSVAPAVYQVGDASVVAVLKERIAADEERFNTQAADLIRQSEEQRKGQAIEEFINHLKARAAIELGEDFLASVVDTGRPLNGGRRR